MNNGDTPFPRLREGGDRGLHRRGRDDPSCARHAGAILRVEIDADGREACAFVFESALVEGAVTSRRGEGAERSMLRQSAHPSAPDPHEVNALRQFVHDRPCALSYPQVSAPARNMLTEDLTLTRISRSARRNET